ncbi:hypothetical protein EI94DRAFT_1580144, partial [Lactarius quietus]
PGEIFGIVQSMVQDHKEVYILPTINAEMNITVGSYTVSLITGVMLEGVTGFDTELASEAF